ncbi:hypothetical protein [Actinomadura rudentiformis]|uniref:Uncharacterized protein n=1 Tax=Actinomadura rudentiformis TaxID=359158 RepID=A0A6H9YUR9_9ACTN|nr:hypothetical protein [Actinomadura rudentiformis]KAB2345170.1 hypothetical protein F8566_28280 [Actinomadura rudentiformis]
MEFLQLVGIVIVFFVGCAVVVLLIQTMMVIISGGVGGIGTLIAKMLGSSRPASSYTAEEYFDKDRKARKRSSDNG